MLQVLLDIYYGFWNFALKFALVENYSKYESNQDFLMDLVSKPYLLAQFIIKNQFISVIFANFRRAI